MTVKEYISELNKQLRTDVAKEHSYRPALKNLLETMLPKLIAINEPARIKCGAPDYILLNNNNLPIAFIEAKDIDDSDLLGRSKNKEQFSRYKKSLDNIIFTDYLDFIFFKNGELIDRVRIGQIDGNKINLIAENEAKFYHIIEQLGCSVPQKVTSPKKLAEIMANKAKLLAEVIEKALSEPDSTYEKSELMAQMDAFKTILIHDITPKTFADIYSQTIAYGMFAARLHDKTPDTFSRHEASELIPKTNPFLRKIFHNIAGYDLDDRISWIVDDLVEVFRNTDIEKIMKGFGKRTRQTDPMIHFYENFLTAYDPATRKSRAVWYTPQPVVSFIVSAVDEILQKEFNLPMGLADTSKVKHLRSFEQSQDLRTVDGKKKIEKIYHKVQILDPATGTGTFLAEVISQIYDKFKGQEGMWQSYVEEHLLPRLNGFELLMASYAVAHLKLDITLRETGYEHKKNERLRIFLTNSLEECHPDTGTLFASWLSNEANEADHIKRDAPVMVILGNPPYSGESKNKGEWILNLMDSYKKEPNSKLKLNERNPKWINDDYCKFIRLGESFVEKNEEGILAYINNHGFINNPTFRGMRWHLLQSFDKIYIIDLHGNSKKKEVALDGSKDENVFDIQQGVSINIFVKTGKKKKGELAELYHYDLYGKRQDKYDFLANNSLNSVSYQKVKPTAPQYFFYPRNTVLEKEYSKGFSVTELFTINSVGIVTANDLLNISISAQEQQSKILDILEMDETKWRSKYKRTKDTRDWTYSSAKEDAAKAGGKVSQISYRPFDIRYTCYSGNSRGLYSYPRNSIMQHFLLGDNIGLITARSNKSISIPDHFFITKNISEAKCGERTTQSCTLPLYLYPTDKQLTIDGCQSRIPNFDMKIIDEIAKEIHLVFESEKSNSEGVFAPIDLLDYIYAILHSPNYRDSYKEFLKVDFPRIPYPSNAKHFWKLVELGGKLRVLHLLESSEISKLITQFPIAGDNIVENVKFEQISDDIGQVWINETQYFNNVPRIAWEFYIGGYQPAQKWLKDRKTKVLNYEDIIHYQRVIIALNRTNELMLQIDQIDK